MSRVEHLSDSVTLYLGDCREILPTLGKVDAVVSDPPYGIGYRRGGGGGGWRMANGARAKREASHSNDAAIVGDDAPFDPSPLLGAEDVILWGGNHFAARLPHGRWLAWDKLAGLPAFDDFSDVEFAWRKGRGKDRIFSLLWKGLLQDQRGGQREKRVHPTQKPLHLMLWCVGMVDPSLRILDPYMGSGTTGVACARLDRPFTGVEIDRKYFDIACRRISEELKAPRLGLDIVPPPSQQEALGL
jgi:site-specific DNA-methyltransferase (adenine-specific)/modification methylase